MTSGARRHVATGASRLARVAVVGMAALSLACATTPGGEAHTVLDVPRPAGPEWFGLYLAGNKVGHLQTWVGVETRDGAPVLVARHVATLSARVRGRPAERTEVSEKIYEPAPHGRLLAFSRNGTGDGEDVRVEGRCAGGGECTVVVVADGYSETRELRRIDETAEQADAGRLAAARRSAVRGRRLDLVTLSMSAVEDRFVGTERLELGGARRVVAVVEQREEGGRSVARLLLAPDGSVVQLQLGQVLANAEQEEVARRLEEVDLWTVSQVTLPAPWPGDVPERMTFRLRGVPREFQRDDARQRWDPQPDGTVRVTVTARRPEASDPSRDAPRPARVPAGMSDLLAPTREVDSDAPAIQALARELVGDTPGVYAAAAKLVHHVYGRMGDGNVPPRARASDVLPLERGGAKDRALLFTALARAAGVPARRVLGLVGVRSGGSIHALHWNEWVEVLSGDEWIAVDPALGQALADATHVRLGRPGYADTAALMGGIQVLEAEAEQ